MRPCAWRLGDRDQFGGEPGVVVGVQLQLRQRIEPVRVEAGGDQHQLRAESVERRQQAFAPRRAECGAARARRQRRVDDVADAALVRRSPVSGYSGNWCELRYSTRGSASKMACVPLPWCTSKSTIATRSSPCASSACAAATAMLLNRQKPIATCRVAWWPGGRTAQNARARSPRRAMHRIDRGHARRRRRAARLRPSPATARCRGRARSRVDRRVSSTSRSKRIVVHAQQLAAAWRAAPRASRVCGKAVAQRVDHRVQARGPFGMAGAGVVRRQAGWV